MLKKLVAVARVVGLISFGCYFEHNYTREDCEVVEVDAEVVYVEDARGHLWSYEAEGYSVGDVVDLKMYDNLTTDIEDDVIKKVVKKI